MLLFPFNQCFFQAIFGYVYHTLSQVMTKINKVFKKNYQVVKKIYQVFQKQLPNFQKFTKFSKIYQVFQYFYQCFQCSIPCLKSSGENPAFNSGHSRPQSTYFKHHHAIKAIYKISLKNKKFPQCSHCSVVGVGH